MLGTVSAAGPVRVNDGDSLPLPIRLLAQVPPPILEPSIRFHRLEFGGGWVVSARFFFREDVLVLGWLP
jgi:hypothetical protein